MFRVANCRIWEKANESNKVASCLEFQELDSVICKEKTKIIRGSIGARWTESGLEVRGNHPVELTYDEFTILKASIYANQTTETDEKRISKGEIEEIIQS